MNNPATRASLQAGRSSRKKSKDERVGTPRVGTQGVDLEEFHESPKKTKGEACCQLCIAIFVILPIVCAAVAAIGAAMIFKVRLPVLLYQS